MIDIIKKKDDYTILKSPSPIYSYIVVLNNYKTISDSIASISFDLKNEEKPSTVIIDNVISNNSFKNRFFKIDFDGDKFQYNTYTKVNEIDKRIKNHLKEFFSLNYDKVVNGSSLSKPKRYIISHKI